MTERQNNKLGSFAGAASKAYKGDYRKHGMPTLINDLEPPKIGLGWKVQFAVVHSGSN
jgi:hypothetical protein